jgi:hypothetical protein
VGEKDVELVLGDVGPELIKLEIFLYLVNLRNILVRELGAHNIAGNVDDPILAH